MNAFRSMNPTLRFDQWRDLLTADEETELRASAEQLAAATHSDVEGAYEDVCRAMWAYR